MRVMVDPNELGAVAQTLEQCAVEVADIGSQLSGCVSCPMPPAVAGDVGALVASADVLLDQIGVVFTNQAAGLLRRAIIAVLDSLSAASGVTTPSTTIGVIGGSSSSGFTITNSDGSPAVGLYDMGGVVGGSWSPTPDTITITLDGRPAIMPEEILTRGGSHAPATNATTNNQMALNIVMAQQNAAVMRDTAKTDEMIQRNSPISHLPPVERHQLP